MEERVSGARPGSFHVETYDKAVDVEERLDRLAKLYDNGIEIKSFVVTRDRDGRMTYTFVIEGWSRL